MPFFAFCKIDKIKGESLDAAHKDQIEVLSFSHSVSQTGGAEVGRTGGITGGGKPDVGDFRIVKVLDKASPDLYKFCCNGAHIPTIVIELCAHKETQHVYMRYTLTDSIVSSVHPGGAVNGEGSRPLEEVTFRFGKIKWEYVPYDDKGQAQAAVPANWNVASGKSE